ncbi:MAG TPA: hypothetical protein VNO75_09525 [Gemmatimonadaceae bacterium]|nr:hypothetical protein [Gemmatimonadaceae bacterium]
MITTEDDSLMTQHGLSTAVDTLDVCESWTGNDYVYQAVELGSSENIPGFEEEIQTVMYQSGYVSGYAATGELISQPSSVGPTAFDFLYADEPTRQASYDYPYYGISSPDPSVCTTCLQIQAGSKPAKIPPATSTVQGDTIGVPRFTRHGIMRLGVRALIDKSEEIGPSIEGYRRFRMTNGTKTTVRAIHPLSQLLMSEEFSEPEGTMRVLHTWTRVPGGYVKDRSTYSSTEQIDGREIRGAGKILFTNVRVTDPRFPVP